MGLDLPNVLVCNILTKTIKVVVREFVWTKMCEKVLAIQDVELLLMRMNKDFDSIH